MQCTMCRRRLRWIAAIGLLSCVLGSCSDEAGGQGSGAHPPPSTGPTTTLRPNASTADTSSARIGGDPFAVPTVIDSIYVDRVLEALDRALGDILRELVSSKQLLPEPLSRLSSLYQGEYLQLRVDLLQEDFRNGFADYRSDPGNQRTTLVRLYSANTSCIFAEVSRDYSAVTPNLTGQGSQSWVSLRPRVPASDPHRINPTPWIITYDGFQPGREAPEDQCAER